MDSGENLHKLLGWETNWVGFQGHGLQELCTYNDVTQHWTLNK